MDLSLAILIGMVAVAMGLALWRGGWQQILAGFKEAGLTFKSVWFRLILGFTLGGLIQVLIPGELVA